MQLIIDTTLPEIAAHLHTLRTRLGGDLTEPMSAVAALLENSSRKRFETQTDPDGQPWAQPPSGGCELKRTLQTPLYRQACQPPSGGCELKPALRHFQT